MDPKMPISYIDAGALMVFDEHVEASARQDMLDALLYIQLAASKKYNKFSVFDDWYNTYLKAMARFGWLVSQRNFHSGPIHGHGPLDLWLQVEHELSGRVPDLLVETAERHLKVLPEHCVQGATQSLLGEHTLQSERKPPTIMGAGDTNLFTVVLQLAFVHKASSVTSVSISFSTLEPVVASTLMSPLDRTLIVGNIKMASVTAQMPDGGISLFRDKFITALGTRRSSMILQIEELLP